MADTFIETALARFKLSAEADTKQRTREQEDLAFQVPEKQWPEHVKADRSAQTVGNITIPPRPMLSIPSLDQPIQLVLNQEKQAHLGVTIHALSEEADDDTAETLQGLYRAIERDSRANLARSWAFDRAVKCGRGAYRVDKAPDRESGNAFDQKIVIKRLLYQAAAYFDPFCQEPDGSDGLYAFVTQDMSFDAYKVKYPKSDMAGYDDDDLRGVGDDAPDWIKGEDGPSRIVRVAEYWRVEVTNKKRVLLMDGTDAFEDEADPKLIVNDAKGQPRAVDVEVRKVFWSLINCIETIKPEQEWDGQYIPLIPVIGRELQPFDGERRWVGIIGPNKDAVRLINYSASSLVEMAALESKAPYTMVEGQQEGHEQEWLLANVRNFPYLLYRNVNLNGQPAPPPQRTQIDASRLGPSMMLLQQGRDFLHSGTGAFEPTLGEDSSRQKSGRAVLALQQQHDQGNSNFLDNLAEISLTYEAKVVLDLIPHVYDRPGRVAKILDKEDNPQTVMLNQAFQPDPRTKRPTAVDAPDDVVKDPNSPVKKYDLAKGRYGVSVSVGKSYQSRLEEGADEIGQVLQADPAMMPLIGPIYFKYRQFPGHTEIAELLKKVRAKTMPGLDDEENDPQAAAHAAEQMKGQIEQMGQQLQQAADMIKTKQVEQWAKIEVEKISAQKDITLQKMKDATSIAVAKINALTKGVVMDNEAEVEAIALAHEAEQANMDRAHEVAMAAAGHQQGLEAGQMAGAQDAALADQGQAHALEQSDMGHQQALEQMAAQPQPTNGSGAA